jgi:hypothetical protein
MATWLAVAMFVALMTTPTESSRFTIALGGGNKSLEFTRQTDGGWTYRLLRPEGAGEEWGQVRRDGTQLMIVPPTAAGEAATEVKVDIGVLLDLPATVDWAKVEKLSFKNKEAGGPLLLQRSAGGLSLTQDDPGVLTKPVTIRWEPKP